jgi:hypothetical protein
MRSELISQSKAKVAHQHDLAPYIIERKNAHLRGSNVLSDTIQRYDLIDNKIRSMNESNARRNVFTLLKFDIKDFINPSSIKCSALTRFDITINEVVSSLTTKDDLEDHLLQRNPIAYWDQVLPRSATLLLEENLETHVTPPLQSQFFMDLSPTTASQSML